MEDRSEAELIEVIKGLFGRIDELKAQKKDLEIEVSRLQWEVANKQAKMRNLATKGDTNENFEQKESTEKN